MRQKQAKELYSSTPYRNIARHLSDVVKKQKVAFKTDTSSDFADCHVYPLQETI